LVLAPTFSNGG